MTWKVYQLLCVNSLLGCVKCTVWSNPHLTFSCWFYSCLTPSFRSSSVVGFGTSSFFSLMLILAEMVYVSSLSFEWGREFISVSAACRRLTAWRHCQAAFILQSLQINLDLVTGNVWVKREHLQRPITHRRESSNAAFWGSFSEHDPQRLIGLHNHFEGNALTSNLYLKIFHSEEGQ